MQEMQEDPLEEEMATHSSILAWKIPWTEEPGGLQSTVSQKESDMTEQINNNSIKSSCELKFYFLTIGKPSSNDLTSLRYCLLINRTCSKTEGKEYP